MDAGGVPHQVPYLAHGGDYKDERREEHRHRKPKKDPEHRHDRRDANGFEAAYQRVQGVGENPRQQEGEKDAAELADKRKEQQGAYDDKDVLRVGRDDQLLCRHPVPKPPRDVI